MGKKSGYGMQNRPYNMLMPYQPHPFIGSWDNPTVGMGMKKKQKEKRKQKKTGGGLLLGKSSPFNGIPLLGAFL